jgi:uncharacterized protein
LRELIPLPVQISLQTNGLLLDEAWFDLFEEANISVGISIDGPEEVNDRARIDHRGNGTYKKVRNAVKLAKERSRAGRLNFGGILSVINPEQSPTNFYRWLRDDLQVSHANVLLPDADHDNYHQYYSYDLSAFSDFLCGLFDEWWNDVSDNSVDIRLFDNLLKKLLGGQSSTEALGTGGAATIIIETDGSIQAHDVFRINNTGHLYGINVNSHDIEQILSDEVFKTGLKWRFKRGVAPILPDSVKCGSCPVHPICGGGFPAHRYSSAKGYNNPSVYCDALFSLITHAYVTVAADCVAESS